MKSLVTRIICNEVPHELELQKQRFICRTFYTWLFFSVHLGHVSYWGLAAQLSSSGSILCSLYMSRGWMLAAQHLGTVFRQHHLILMVP